MANILITGGTGYIGSNIVVELLNHGDNVTIVDSSVNSKSQQTIKEIELTSNRSVNFEKGNMLDIPFMVNILKHYQIDCVVDAAGFKAVGESVDNPLKYFKNNVEGIINLLIAMEQADVKKIVFSSSACVYGEPETTPLKEIDTAIRSVNPYGTSKMQGEQILQDVVNSNHGWSAISLRYFNPLGAQSNGTLGDDPSGRPNNLGPAIFHVLLGKLDHLSIFGDDYATPDGSAIRDYIHVVDLAKGHLAAIDLVMQKQNYFDTINLGSGKGYSVFEIKNGFEQASHQKIPFQISPRRPGDAKITVADINKAKQLLDWQPQLSLKDMCESSWQFLQRGEIR